MTEHENDALQQLIARALWWVLGVFGSLFVSASIALVTVLWTFNGTLSTTQERIGAMMMRLDASEKEQKAQNDAAQSFYRDIDARVRVLESRGYKKPGR